MGDRVAYLEHATRQAERQSDANAHGIAELDRRVEALESTVRSVAETDRATDEKLRAAIDALKIEWEAQKNFFRGIRTTIIAAVSIAGAVSGAVTWLVSHFAK